MADGTYLNEVWVPRVFKSNARYVAEEAESNIRFIRGSLMAHVGHHPTLEELEEVRVDVDTLMDELIDNAWRLFAAEYILSYPELCIDETEERKGKSNEDI